MFFTAPNADSSLLLPHCAKALFLLLKKSGFSYCKISFKQLLYCRKDTMFCAKPFCKVVKSKLSTLQDFFRIQAFAIFHHCYETSIWDWCKAMLYLPSDIQLQQELLVTSSLTSNSCAEDESSSGPVQISSTNNDALCDASPKHLFDKSTISGSTNLQKASRNRIELCIKYGLSFLKFGRNKRVLMCLRPFCKKSIKQNRVLFKALLTA